MPTPAVSIRAASRISAFQSYVNSHCEEIRAAGLAAWKNVTAKSEVPRVREYLINPGCGTDYLNKNLAKELSTAGRVVKFASIFLHAKPMVFGWKDVPSSPPANGKGTCELGDLQTLFLYLDKNKTLCQARSVIFQAKMLPETGSYVIDTEAQRKLYDQCGGFRYRSILGKADRKLPSGHLRERALQYLFVEESQLRARTIPADIDKGAFVDCGEHLFRFLNDSTGLDVTCEPDKQTEWSNIVWDMVDHVANQTVHKEKIGTLTGLKSGKETGHPRHSGLNGLLDYFNCFENYDQYSLKSDGGSSTEDEGFGLQLVIVWDGGLNLETDIPITPLCELEDHAATYFALPDLADTERREQLAREMATRVFKAPGLRDQIVQSVETSANDALIVALCIAISQGSVSEDSKRLLAVARAAKSNNARSRVVSAFKTLLDRRELPETQFAEVVEILSKYPNSHEVVELRQTLETVNASQFTEELVTIRQSF